MNSNGSVRPHERTSLLPENDNHEGAASQLQHPKDPRIWVRWPMQIVHLTWCVLASSYVNVLLVFVPIGIIAGALEWGPAAVFVLNFFAIVPLASLLSFATEELAATMGQTLGGLLNATFGNAVELIVCAASSLPPSF
jgi:Ca2+:H+ antiporter